MRLGRSGAGTVSHQCHCLHEEIKQNSWCGRAAIAKRLVVCCVPPERAKAFKQTCARVSGHTICAAQRLQP